MFRTGESKCEQCPVKEYCIAHAENLTAEIPVKKKAKARKIEERTVLIFKDGKQIAIRKRPAKGLLAGLYEFPNLEGKFSMAEVTEYSKKIGLMLRSAYRNFRRRNISSVILNGI